MLDSDELTLNGAALGVFLVCWLGYRLWLRLAWGRRGIINADMDVIRARWMITMAHRKDQRLLDGQLMGHALSSGSFFASSNLILIAAAGGVGCQARPVAAGGPQHADAVIGRSPRVLSSSAWRR